MFLKKFLVCFVSKRCVKKFYFPFFVLFGNYFFVGDGETEYSFFKEWSNNTTRLRFYINMLYAMKKCAKLSKKVNKM